MSGGAAEDEAEAKAFLLKLRYSPAVADGVILALKSSGALLPTLYAMAGAWVRVPLPPQPTHEPAHKGSPATTAAARERAVRLQCTLVRCLYTLHWSEAYPRLLWDVLGTHFSRGAGSGG